MSELACDVLGMGCAIHELSVQVACGRGQDDQPEISKYIVSSEGFSPCSDSVKEALTNGVRLPDEKSCNNELYSDFIDQTLSHDKAKNIHPLRVSHQHIHGSPLPLVRNSEKAYTTHQQWRNQMLLQSSVWYCSTIAAPEPAAYLKLGLIFHTLGDTYSESHVKRAVPDGIDTLNPCGPRNQMPLRHGYSMDYASWYKHIPPDRDVDNPLFRCLMSQMKDILTLARTARESYSEASSETGKLEVADNAMGRFITYLCQHSWYMDEPTLAKPAGGMPEHLSSTGRPEFPRTLSSSGEFQGHLAENAGFNWYAGGTEDLCTLLKDWSESTERSLKCSAKELDDARQNINTPPWSYLEHSALSYRLDWTDGLGFDVVRPEKTP